MTDFSVDHGTDNTLDLVLVDGANQPLNLTGASIWFTAKRRYSDTDADAIIQKTVGDGITVDNAAGGLAHVTLLPEDTFDLPFYRQTFRYDVKVKSSDGISAIVARGQLTIEPAVTSAT